MDAHVVDGGKSPNAPPRLLQVDQVLSWHLTNDDVGIAILVRQVGQ